MRRPSNIARQILGHTDRHWAEHGAEIRLMTPTVHAADVHEHVHAEAHFIVVLAGRYRSEADGADDSSTAPQVIFNPPGTRHRDCFHALQALREARFLSLVVSPTRWQTLTTDAGLPGWASALQGQAATEASRVLQQALAARDPLATDFAVAAVAALFAQQVATIEDTAPPWLHRLRRWLDELAAEPHEVVRHAQLAAQCGVHPVHLARAFRRHYRCSPAQYLRARRLDRAAALLQRQDHPILQIAMDAGFHDQPHFTRAFAARFGLTPAHYRASTAPRDNSHPLAANDSLPVSRPEFTRSTVKPSDR